jgi:hypothetical protein
MVTPEAQVNQENQELLVHQVHQDSLRDPSTKNLPHLLDIQVLLVHQDNQELLAFQAFQLKIFKLQLTMENLIHRDIPVLLVNQVFPVNQALQEPQESQDLIPLHQNPAHLQ